VIITIPEPIGAAFGAAAGLVILMRRGQRRVR
jgi:hypothetical protein